MTEPTPMNVNEIKLTNEQLNNIQFLQSLNKIANMSLPIKTSYKISYIKDKVDRHTRQGREIFHNVAKKYAELDEKGNLVPETDPRTNNPIPGSFKFKSDEAGKEFRKEEKEFMAIEHTIPKHKLSVDELGATELTANDISVLKPLFSDLD